MPRESRNHGWEVSPQEAAMNTMPHNATAENEILAAMLINEDAREECLMELKPSDFYQPANRKIFSAMQVIYDRGGAIDPTSLIDYLKSHDELELAGGNSYIVELGINAFAVRSWRGDIEILRRDSTLRSLIQASSQIMSLAYNSPEDTKEVINTAEQMVLSVTNREIRSNYATLESVMSDLYTELAEQAAQDSDSLGVNTGFPGIDSKLLGLRAGQMVVIGARPGVGKTSFGLNLAVNAAAAGASVAFFSLEMSKAEIAQRLLSSQARINLQDIRSAKIKDDQWGQIIQSTQELAMLDIMIDDTPGTTITEVRAKARRMLHGKENGVVILDYLQLVSPPSGNRRADSRATEVSEMSRGIKIMAKDLEVPVIALSQLNRQVADRKGQRPQLSDLRESGSIEQDADIVILLDRSMTDEEASRDDRPDKGITDFIIAKNRSGPLDIVPLTFLAGSTKFVEVDKYHGD